ncbi:unnamed protein product, partial [Dicrocoelium dendriticum]
MHELAAELSEPLTCVFTLSPDSCAPSSEWKDAIICPIFKDGDSALPANYRLVSLTRVVVKLFEELVRNMVENHLNKLNVLSAAQHDFLKGFLCLTNLLLACEIR